MGYRFDAQARERLEEYFGLVGCYLNNEPERRSFLLYASGLMGEGKRKSVEPIAARLTSDPKQCQRLHGRLLDFLSRGRWKDAPVRREAARYAIEQMGRLGQVLVWVVDDTGMIKKGNASVGVARQYTGTTGKVDNCQVAVSLSVANEQVHLPIDFELYLPKAWLDDPERRRKVRIPAKRRFETKIDLALRMIDRAVRAGIPGQIVLADSGYGNSVEFRETVRLAGFDYGVAIQSTTTVHRHLDSGGYAAEAVTVRQLADSLPRRAFRSYRWREGSEGRPLSSRFSFQRVKVAADDGSSLPDREEVWLVIEWPQDEPKPTKFFLTTLADRWSRQQTIRLIKERYRTEQAYREMKQELGLDHYEGRSFPGWHHHVTVVLACYAFIVAERSRGFSP